MMKTLIRVVIVPVLLLIGLSIEAAAQKRSDYAIVNEFESRYKDILKSINQVKTVQECADVSTSIDELEKSTVENRDLLDKAMFPDKFDERILKARVQLRLFQEKLGIIESQVVHIAELETKVRELSAMVEKLSGENAALLNDVKRLDENVRTVSKGDLSMIDSLKSVITKLQSNLRDRDNMIFALVDSLFLQYDKDVSGLKDIEKQRIVVKVDKNNVLSNVKKSIQDNIAFLDATQLTGSDLSKVLKEQRKFSSQWKGLGAKLAQLYLGGKQRTSELAQVDTLLVRWEGKTSVALWKAFNAAFKQNGVVVKEFATGQEFFTNVTAMLDAEIQNPTKEGGDARYKRYTNFEEKIWKSDVGTVWIPMLAEQGKITDAQKKEIESKVDKWRSTVSPPSIALYVAIFLLIVVLLAGLYVRNKKGKTQA